MNEMNCKSFEEQMPDLLLDEAFAASDMAVHLAVCPSCAKELQQLRATFDLMDSWTAPELSPYFDTQLYARLREEQTAGPSGAWSRLAHWLQGNLSLRPALAGALGLAMVLGGGTAVTRWAHHAPAPTISSPTVDDLKIYDNNAQAVDQLDMLDDAGDSPSS